ncbi:ABC transporter ATP-binding protein [bacterium]|nr:ABC transporter ATP-binding protein [bacterium]
MSDSAILTHQLSRSFGSLVALDNLSLAVPRGTIFGFLGPNGAGKTTTIRLLLGLLEPSAGTARVLGYDTVAESDLVRERCGALLEHPGLYERLSALDNLEFYGRVYRLSAAERRARIEELLNHVGLWERRGERIKDWSRGMRQKLAVARLLLHRPQLIFLDEPTAGLDAVAAAALREDLLALKQREGVSIFLTTHYLAEAEKLCDRVAVINKGRLVAEGAPGELLADKSGQLVRVEGRSLPSEGILEAIRHLPGVREASFVESALEVRLENGFSAAPLVRLLVELGAEIEQVRKVKASLEESFLALLKEDR